MPRITTSRPSIPSFLPPDPLPLATSLAANGRSLHTELISSQSFYSPPARSCSPFFLQNATTPTTPTTLSLHLCAAERKSLPVPCRKFSPTASDGSRWLKDFPRATTPCRPISAQARESSAATTAKPAQLTFSVPYTACPPPSAAM